MQIYKLKRASLSSFLIKYKIQTFYIKLIFFLMLSFSYFFPTESLQAQIESANKFSKAFMGERKIIGIIGGISDQATVEYYKLINDEINKIEKGTHIGEILIYSVDVHNINEFIKREDWENAAKYLVDKAKRLEAAGADFLILTSNTMHRVASKIESEVNIPILYIFDATAEAILDKKIKKVGILGTKPVMEHPFYRDYYKNKFDIDLIVPDEFERQEINSIIFEELAHGIINPKSKLMYIRVMDNLVKKGAQGIILGCTEIPLLVTQEDYAKVPLFNTTALHAKKAARTSLGITHLPH